MKPSPTQLTDAPAEKATKTLFPGNLEDIGLVGDGLRPDATRNNKITANCRRGFVAEKGWKQTVQHRTRTTDRNVALMQVKIKTIAAMVCECNSGWRASRGATTYNMEMNDQTHIHRKGCTPGVNPTQLPVLLGRQQTRQCRHPQSPTITCMAKQQIALTRSAGLEPIPASVMALTLGEELGFAGINAVPPTPSGHQYCEAQLMTIDRRPLGIEPSAATVTNHELKGETSTAWAEAPKPIVNKGEVEDSAKCGIMKKFTFSPDCPHFTRNFRGFVNLARNSGNPDNRPLLPFFTPVFGPDAAAIFSAICNWTAVAAGQF